MCSSWSIRPVSGICAMSCDAIEVAHVAEGNVDGYLFMRVLQEEILSYDWNFSVETLWKVDIVIIYYGMSTSI